MKVAVIGGGAAGFYAAICCKEFYPKAKVTIYEKTNKLLSKVKISGGGRCNVTHDAKYPSDLAKNYPRGGKQLKKHFKSFNNKHIIEWFESRGVALKVEPDGRMFPTTDQSQTIIDTFMKEVEQLGIDIQLKSVVDKITRRPEGTLELMVNGKEESYTSVIIATGGSNKRTNYSWLEKMGHEIVEPIPSLFTFNMPKERIIKLMGVSVAQATASIVGTKYVAAGPLLITHWGMSGPAILKLSSIAARHLHTVGYEFEVAIKWSGDHSEEQLQELILSGGQKLIKNNNPLELPNRLWMYFLDRADINPDQVCSELSKKQKNKLVHSLYYDIYQVRGKTTFKEEFVTCGGVSWDSIDAKTLRSKAMPGLYFAGEVLDIDGITGGFNFQAAWTTGWVAGQLG
jgi:predicted Rossmann fold flavoprotein